VPVNLAGAMTADVHASDVSVNVGPSIFRRRGFAVIPHLIEPSLAAYFWSYAHTKFASRLL
jgi:hypothetical protein